MAALHVTGVGAVVVLAVMQAHIFIEPKLTNTLDTHLLGWDKTTAMGLFGDYGRHGREMYLSFNLVDMFLPLCYGPFLYLLLHKQGQPWPVCTIPLISGALDICENISTRLLTHAYPQLDTVHPYALRFGPIATVAKFGLLAISVLLVMVASGPARAKRQ